MVDYSKVDIEVAREVLRQGEVRLQAMLALTIGANQRAVTLGGILTTATVATMAGAVAVSGEKGSGAVFWAGILCAALLFLGAVACVIAMWPMDYYVPGNEPKNWMSEDVLTGSLADTMLNEAGNNQTKVEHNARVICYCGRCLKAGATLGCAAPILSTALWAALHFLGAVG